MKAESSTPHARPRAGPLYLLAALLAFQGVSALFGGSALVLDPSGQGLDLPVDRLAGTPFRDYLIPGLILLLVLGVLPLVTLATLWRDTRATRTGRREAHARLRGWWYASLAVGVGLMVWIVTQGVLIGFGHWLQWSYGIVGVAITATTLLPAVRRHAR